VLLLQPRTGAPRVITDSQLSETMARFRPATGLRRGTPEYDAAWQVYTRELEDARNQPGGYWLAAADPAATSHALTGSEPMGGRVRRSPRRALAPGQDPRRRHRRLLAGPGLSSVPGPR
jgi:hypothetical protein